MKTRLKITSVALAALICGLVVDASPDTIYMKNGRMIRSSAVRVEGDRVFVRLYDGEVAFPLDTVERIVEDDAVESSATRPAVGAQEAAEAGPDVEATGGDAAAGAVGEPAAADPDATGGAPATDPAADPQEPAAPAPEETREYWQNRIRPLNEQLGRMDAQLQSLRSRTGADVQAQIGRIESQRARVQSQLDEIIREGRRRGIPPGWLR